MSTLVVIVLSATDVFAVLLNALVIFTFWKIKAQLTFKDNLMIGMAVSDIMQCLLGYPLEIYSSQHGNWKFDIYSCMASGFFITCLGLVSINYLGVIAADLYYSICKPYFATVYHESRGYIIASNVFPWLFSFLWSVFPFIGWSSYALESDGLRCSINWNGQSSADKSYIAALFVFQYALPIGVMLYSFIAVKYEIRSMQLRVAGMSGAQAEAAMESVRAEKKHTKLAIVMCTTFIVSWTPYTLISFWSSYFQSVSTVPPSLGTVSAIFAKMSTLVNPIIYSFLHSKFRRNLRVPFVGQVLAPTSVGPELSTKQTSSTVRRSVAE